MDNIQPLSIRLDSLDLEAARSTTDAARSSDQMPQLPNRNPWVFRPTRPPNFPISAFFGGRKSRAMSAPGSQVSPKPVIHPLHNSEAPSARGKYQPGRFSNDAHDLNWNPSSRDGRVRTRVWAADACGAPAVNNATSGDDEMDEGVVRVERHISSSSEVSPPKPTHH